MDRGVRRTPAGRVAAKVAAAATGGEPLTGRNARRGLMLLSDHFRVGVTSREHAARYRG
ncbi:hypothetical protein [Streptomyces cyaneus]|uniref:hypothetical protein n=1 Tax=Streptomyces cyaneus TaxID=1904 RepID=UPI001FEB6C4C|nr:hypothetical protein [Streptomyces cyaneus]